MQEQYNPYDYNENTNTADSILEVPLYTGRREETSRPNNRKRWWKKRWFKVVSISFCVLLGLGALGKCSSSSNEEPSNRKVVVTVSPSESASERSASTITEPTAEAPETASPTPATTEAKQSTGSETAGQKSTVEEKPKQQESKAPTAPQPPSQDNYALCKDGTQVPADSDRSAKGKANACYGHGGFL